MIRKLAYEHPSNTEAKELGTVMGILLGLRYGRELGELITEKVKTMVDLRESSVYQMILDEGKAEGTLQALRDTILRQGRKKFGKPSAKIVRELNAITSAGRLVQLSDRLLDVDSWKELLTSDS
jgi:predicted transposase YdaD